MRGIVFFGHELLAELLPYAAVLALFAVAYRRRGIEVRATHYLACVVFGFYVVLVFNVTGIGTLRDILKYGFELRPGEINLLPFSRDINARAYYQNVLMLVPFGFMLPIVWPRTNRFYIVPPAGLLFSLLIETSQLFNHRSTDVDDLIMNTLGAIAGYTLFRLLMLITRQERRASGLAAWEPVVCIAAIYFGRFFLL